MPVFNVTSGITKIYLGTDEISKIYHGEDLVFSNGSLRYLWNFEDNLTDDINGLTLTQGNPISYPTGKVGKGLYNVSGNTNIAYTNDATLCAMLSGRKAYSIATWIKVEPAASGYFRPLRHGNAGFTVSYGSNNCYYFQRASTSQWVVSTSFSKNVWHHLVYAYDGNNIVIYYDGNLVATRADAGSPLITQLTLITASDTTAKGMLDITHVYDYCLSLSEVQALYNI